MGQFGSSALDPIRVRVRNVELALVLAACAAVSSTATVALLALIGRVAFGEPEGGWRIPLVGAAATVALLGLVHAAVPRYARPPMLHRQAPQRARRLLGDMGAAAWWGFDAGLLMTTYRIGWGTWTLLTVAALGFSPWWIGACYSLGFGVPVAAAAVALAIPTTTVDSIAERFSRPRNALRASAALQAVAIVGVAIATVASG